MKSFVLIVALLVAVPVMAQAPQEPASLVGLRAAVKTVETRLLATEDGKLYLQLQRAVADREAELKAAAKPADVKK